MMQYPPPAELGAFVLEVAVLLASLASLVAIVAGILAIIRFIQGNGRRKP